MGTFDLSSAGCRPSARSLDVLTKVFLAVLLHGDLHFPLGSLAVGVAIWGRAEPKGKVKCQSVISFGRPFSGTSQKK